MNTIYTLLGTIIAFAIFNGVKWYIQHGFRAVPSQTPEAPAARYKRITVVILALAVLTIGVFVMENLSEKRQKELSEQAKQLSEQAKPLLELGYKYRYGKDVPKDDRKSFEYFMEAAKKGNAEGQYNLGYIYHEGLGVPKSEEKSVEWYGKAAAQGHDVGGPRRRADSR